MADYVLAENLYHSDWTKSIRYVEDDLNVSPATPDVFVFPRANISRVSVEERFERLAAEWEKQTQYLSSTTQIVLNESYQQIIGLGPTVLPLIFARLADKAQHWFWALRAITGEDPSLPDATGNMRAIREAWLGWAHEHGYL